mmetsp:Transcript_19621/g.50687  ORF Transcript_19621/g.50687 Transcript_19621/m.50687 type:complete len:237 (+) Transcript_19621:675-1385(+)
MVPSSASAMRCHSHCRRRTFPRSPPALLRRACTWTPKAMEGPALSSRTPLTSRRQRSCKPCSTATRCWRVYTRVAHPLHQTTLPTKNSCYTHLPSAPAQKSTERSWTSPQTHPARSKLGVCRQMSLLRAVHTSIAGKSTAADRSDPARGWICWLKSPSARPPPRPSGMMRFHISLTFNPTSLALVVRMRTTKAVPRAAGWRLRPSLRANRRRSQRVSWHWWDVRLGSLWPSPRPLP